jgi:hypothetical protein
MAPMLTNGVLALCGVGLVFVAYYYFTKRALLRLARSCASRSGGWGSARPVLEKVALYEIVFVVASHLVFVALLLGLCAGLGLAVPGLTVGIHTLALLPLAAGVGLGQMTTSIFVCQLIIAGISVLGARRKQPVAAGGRPAAAGLTPQAWTDYSRAGWMRHHLVASRAVPRTVSMPLTTLQLACEEIVFRAVFPLLLAVGFTGGWSRVRDQAPVLPMSSLALGLVVSSILFVLMQGFFMPSWRSAMFPVVGSAMMAASHCYLYATVGQLWPLVLAHAVSFFAAARQ